MELSLLYRRFKRMDGSGIRHDRRHHCQTGRRRRGGFADWSHETGEETRFVVVPLNTNGVDDIRRLWVQTPYDDCSLVRPVLTLLWAGANDLRLFREDGSSFPNGGEIDSRAVASWPLRFRAGPLAPTTEFAARVLGEADNVTGEKAADTIHGRVVNVDLDAEADGEPGVTDADESKEEDPGGYACVCTNSLTPINLTLEPAGLPGKVTLSATMGGSRIRVWQDAGRATEVPLTTGVVWNAGAAIPGTLYVEGVTNSAALRDVELRLEYDENPPGQSNPLFKCADAVRLTVIKVDTIEPDSMANLEEIDDGDGNPKTRIFVVPIAEPMEYPVDPVTVRATITPSLSESQLPAGWTLQGGTGSEKLTRTVSRTVSAGASKTEFTFTCGGTDSGLKTTVYVYDAKVGLFADEGDLQNIDVEAEPLRGVRH